MTGDLNRVEGNRIGSDATGMLGLGNDDDGVRVESDENTITSNLIVDNSDGVEIAPSATTSEYNVVKSNLIGLNLDQTGSIPNDFNGIVVANTNNNTIGGTADGDGNVIAGHATAGGLQIIGTTGYAPTGNVVQGNFIGVNSSLEELPAFSNLVGIIIMGTAHDNLIGGTADGAANHVINNTSFGLAVMSVDTLATFPVGNAVVSNSMFNNGSVDIDLLRDTDGNFFPDAEIGVTPNDVGDPDTGPNDLLNFPVFSDVSSSEGMVDVTFDLDVDEAVAEYRVEFFASIEIDATGHGPGQTLLGSTNVSGDVTGQVASLTAPESLYGETMQISATVTEVDGSSDGFGSTSEFSGAEEVEILPPAGFTSSGLADTGITMMVQILAVIIATVAATGALVVKNRYKVYS
ncbi:MAG: hypothetical protein M3P98_03055 [bacterium]|nr:hypothetical protein [bacterium]